MDFMAKTHQKGMRFPDTEYALLEEMWNREKAHTKGYAPFSDVVLELMGFPGHSLFNDEDRNYFAANLLSHLIAFQVRPPALGVSEYRLSRLQSPDPCTRFHAGGMRLCH